MSAIPKVQAKHLILKIIIFKMTHQLSAEFSRISVQHKEVRRESEKHDQDRMKRWSRRTYMSLLRSYLLVHTCLFVLFSICKKDGNARLTTSGKGVLKSAAVAAVFLSRMKAGSAASDRYLLCISNEYTEQLVAIAKARLQN